MGGKWVGGTYCIGTWDLRADDAELQGRLLVRPERNFMTGTGLVFWDVMADFH